MTHRVSQFLLCAIVSGLFLITTRIVAQDSPQPAATKSSTEKLKKNAPSATTQEAAKADSANPADSDKNPLAKPAEAKKEEAKKKEDAAPAVESPKLIQVPQDETTYAQHPRVAAVFVFTNGHRIESDDYLITKDALFINKDGQKTRYQINSLDRAATKAANEGRGVDVLFPKSKSEFNLDF